MLDANSPRLRRFYPLLYGLAAFALFSACVGRGGTPDAASNRYVTLTTPAPVYPLAYFDHRCSRCHGPFGSHYGDGFVSELSDDELWHEVEDMAAGPGFQPLDGVALEAQVAFHRSLVDRRPFVIWCEAEGPAWHGETMPGAEVFLRLGDEMITAEVNGFAWTITLSQEIALENAPGPVELIARFDDAETCLDLTRSAFSHSTPLTSMDN